MDIFGQDKIVEAFDAYSRANAPKTLILTGEDALTRAKLIDKYASRLDMQKIDVVPAIYAEHEKSSGAKIAEIVQDDLFEYSMSPVSRLYHIDLGKLKQQNLQNLFLKFVEEPGPYAYIAITADSEKDVLPTVLSRGIRYEMRQYSPAELKEYFGWMTTSSEPKIFEVCTTPEQLQNISVKAFKSMYSSCEELIAKANLMSLGEMLRLADKINYKEDYDKCDVKVFLNILAKVARDAWIGGSELAYKAYCAIVKYRPYLLSKGAVADQTVLRMLTELWEVTR